MEPSFRRSLLLLSCIGVLVVVAGGQTTKSAWHPTRLAGDGQLERRVLTVRQLLDGTDLPSPVDDLAAFQLPSQAAEPTESFEGTLALNVANPTHFNLLSDVFQLVPSGDSPWRRPPAFRIQLVQYGSFIIPVAQGLIFTGNPAWNYIVGPGRVWRETGDGGYTRAALPFALVQRNQNCTHNGVLSFLFSTKKNPRVSRVFYQITQETCYPMKFDMWGMLDEIGRAHV